MADLTYAQARALIKSDLLTAFAMLLSGNQPDGTVIDTVGGGGGGSTSSVMVNDTSGVATNWGEDAASPAPKVTPAVLQRITDAVTAYGRPVLEFNVVVTADDTVLIAAPAANHWIRLHSWRFSVASGAAHVVAGHRYGPAAGAGATPVASKDIGTGYVPIDGERVWPDFRDLDPATTLHAYLSGAHAGVRFSGYYEIIASTDLIQ